METARSVADGVVVVVPPTPGGGTDRSSPADERRPGGGADRTVAGGDTRAASVRAGLAAVPDDAAVIVVHDAARPLATGFLFDAVVDVVRSGRAAGAIPVLPVADTLKRVTGETVDSTVDREGLVTVQTPQAFEAAVLRAAHAGAGEASDDAGLVEQLGATVLTVPGDPRNLKITRPEDLELAEHFLRTVQG